MLNTELGEKINFSVIWGIPRKIILIIQYLLTLLKTKLLEYTKQEKRSKVGYDNKEARDSKKNGYLNFSFKLGEKKLLKREIWKS